MVDGAGRAVFQRCADQRFRPLHDGARACGAAQVADILEEAGIGVAAADGQCEHVAGDGLRGERSPKDGAGGQADGAGADRAGCGGKTAAGLCGEAGPGLAVCRFVVAVKSNGGVEALANRVPGDGGGGVAFVGGEVVARALHGLRAVLDGGHAPRGTGVHGVVEAAYAATEAAGRNLCAFGAGGNRSDDQAAAGGAPGKAAEALADEGVKAGGAVVGTLDQRPGNAAVGGAQQARAVVAVGCVIGVASAGKDDAGAARLHGDRADGDAGRGAGTRVGAEGLQAVHERRELDRRGGARGVGALPHAATGGAQVYSIAGAVGWVDRDARHPPGDGAVCGGLHLHGADSLPRGVEWCGTGGEPGLLRSMIRGVCERGVALPKEATMLFPRAAEQVGHRVVDTRGSASSRKTLRLRTGGDGFR